MSHHRLQMPDRGTACLGSATAAAAAEMAKPGVAAIDAPENWLICQLLRREAEQLITATPPSRAGR
jgi:hypothetical protein